MDSGQPPYKNRVEAGAALAKLLAIHSSDLPVVVGLPRGGLPVAAEIAKALRADLDIIVAGKLRAPYNPELAIGAVAESGQVYLNPTVIRSLHVTGQYIEEEKQARLEAVREKLNLFKPARRKVSLKGRTVIIVDDGLATGSTMISAIQAAHASGARRIIVAVPGGPADTVELIRKMEEVDEVVCPEVPEMFFAVSQLYRDFRQVEDGEVTAILREFQERSGKMI